MFYLFADDLPTYLGDRVLEHKEFVYIGLAVVFTGIFAVYFGIVCTKDSGRKMHQRVKRTIARCKRKKEPVERTAEEELRQVLMINTHTFNRRVSQPYDTTLNTITGGELAKQLKFELKKLEAGHTDANDSNHSLSKGNHHSHHINFHMPFHRQLSHHHGRVASAGEIITLLDHDNNDILEKGLKNSDRAETTTVDVHSKVTPSVIVSDHNGNGTEVVLLDQGNLPSSSGAAPGTSSTGNTRQVSRFQVTAITEDNPPHKKVPETQASSMQTAVTKSKSRFGVSKKYTPLQSTSGSPFQSRSIFGLKAKDNKHKTKTKSLDVPDGGSSGADSETSTESDLPSSKYLVVPSLHRVISSQTDSSSTIKKPKGRFSLQHIDEKEKTIEAPRDIPPGTDPLNVQKNNESNKPEQADSAAVVKPKPSRFTVQKVEEDAGTIDEKRKAFLEKLEKQTPKAVKGKGKTMSRYHSDPDTSSPGIRRSSTDETISKNDLPQMAQTVHAFTHIKWWDEVKGKYSYVTHL